MAVAAGKPSLRRSAPPKKTETARVLVVEDNLAVRTLIVELFAHEPEFEVAGEAGSLAEARRMLHDVDVVILDLGLPDGFGGDLIGDLHEIEPGAQVVIFSASLDRS